MSLKTDEKVLTVNRKVQIFIMGMKNIHSYKRVRINRELRLVLISAGWHFIKGIKMSTTKTIARTQLHG